MKLKSQKKRMLLLADYVGRDLSSGSSTDGTMQHKYTFLKTGEDFLKQFAQDLMLQDCSIRICSGGIAIGGDIFLTGMWNKRLGLKAILHPEDYTGILTVWMTSNDENRFRHKSHNLRKPILYLDYAALIDMFLAFKANDEQRFPTLGSASKPVFQSIRRSL